MSLEQNTAIARAVYEAQRAFDDATAVYGAMPSWEGLDREVQERKRVEILCMRHSWDAPDGAGEKDALFLSIADAMIAAFESSGR